MKNRRTTTENSSNMPPVSKEDAKAFEDSAIDRLKAKGFRITMPRVQVIRVLGQSNQALSAYGIHERILDMGGRIDVVSVYRILATLVEVGLIHHIGVVDGYLACRINPDHANMSEHVIDQNTGSVIEVEIPSQAVSAIEKQLKGMGFETLNIKIEIIASSKAA